MEKGCDSTASGVATSRRTPSLHGEGRIDGLIHDAVACVCVCRYLPRIGESYKTASCRYSCLAVKAPRSSPLATGSATSVAPGSGIPVGEAKASTGAFIFRKEVVHGSVNSRVPNRDPCDRQIDVLTRLWSACLENSFAGSTLLVINWFDFAYLLVYLLICLFACLFVCLLMCLFVF